MVVNTPPPPKKLSMLADFAIPYQYAPQKLQSILKSFR